MNNPRVLLVGPSFSGGGAEIRFANIARNLYSGAADAAILSAKEEISETTPQTTVDLGWSGRRSYPQVVARLRRQLRTKTYDAIFSFGLFPSVVSAAALAGMKSKPAFIVCEITRPVAAGRHSPPLRRITHTILRKLSYRRADLMTANSIDGVQELGQLIGLSPERLRRLPNVVDSGGIRRATAESSSYQFVHRPYAVSMARLVRMKRIDVAIRAITELKQHEDVHLVIMGDGPLRQPLEALASRMQIRSRVHFLGMVRNPFPVLQSASSFILASEYEGLSNAVLEAMFCDVPVVTSLCSSDARAMCEAGAALGFRVGDTQDLAKHLLALLHKPSLASKVIGGARRYRAFHALENAIRAYEEVIVQAISIAGKRQSEPV